MDEAKPRSEQHEYEVLQFIHAIHALVLLGDNRKKWHDRVELARAWYPNIFQYLEYYKYPTLRQCGLHTGDPPLQDADEHEHEQETLNYCMLAAIHDRHYRNPDDIKIYFDFQKHHAKFKDDFIYLAYGLRDQLLDHPTLLGRAKEALRAIQSDLESDDKEGEEPASGNINKVILDATDLLILFELHDSETPLTIDRLMEMARKSQSSAPRSEKTYRKRVNRLIEVGYAQRPGRGKTGATITELGNAIIEQNR